ncbi:MAG: argG, partial [Rhodopila sp.]|nr:argG [Rhodopila sp.]
MGATPRAESLEIPCAMAVKDVKKVVLAYSGGLDTSVILRWLQTTYGC